MSKEEAGFRTRLVRCVLGTAPASLLLVSCQAPSSNERSRDRSENEGSPEHSMLAAPGSPAAKLQSRNEGNWINVTGTILAKLPRAFILQYGAGDVRVELDDWDWYQEGRGLRPGDRVAVTGRIDEDASGNKIIEARSVFVERLQTHFLASGADEESLRNNALYRDPRPGHVEAIGRILAIEGHELTLGPTTTPLLIDTSRMTNNPLDRRGVQQIEVGDQVYVWGVIDNTARHAAGFKALGVVKFHRAQGKAR